MAKQYSKIERAEAVKLEAREEVEILQEALSFFVKRRKKQEPGSAWNM